MADVAAFAPEDARMILQVCRQVQSSGVLSHGYMDRILRKFPRFSGGGGAINASFFKLNAAVVTAETITGLASTYSGTTSEPPVDLINWADLLDGAPLDYLGLFVQVDDEWVFAQGPCISGGGGGGGNPLVFSLQTGLGF